MMGAVECVNVLTGCVDRVCCVVLCCVVLCDCLPVAMMGAVEWTARAVSGDLCTWYRQ